MCGWVLNNMPTIENISMIAFANGVHTEYGDNTIAIQILDPCGSRPTPNKSFSEIHQFEFLDIDNPNDTDFGEFAITEEQAKRLCEILLNALDAGKNIVVHCTVGVCRSGAVVEVASMIGFAPIHNNRIPNTLVKRRMMKVLNLSYDVCGDFETEQTFPYF